MYWTWGPDDQKLQAGKRVTIKLHQKLQAGKRVTIELHLLSHHHRDDRGVHMPVGDISKTESWERALTQPGTSLQYLPDCAAHHKQQRSSNLPDFVCSDLQPTCNPLRSRSISVAVDKSNPYVTGTSRPLVERSRSSPLWHPQNYLSKGWGNPQT